MRAYLIWIAIITMVVLLFATGCGGGGGSAANSPFVGSWSGPWSDPGNGQSGTLNITVAQNGNVTGQILNNTLNATGAASGNVTNDGNLSATYSYTGLAPVTANGTVAIGANGHMTGTVTEKQNGQTAGTATFDLAKQ